MLAIREGATANATVVKELLEDLVARGVKPEQKRLFVTDGSKALSAINAVFGSHQPVQRWRAHKTAQRRRSRWKPKPAGMARLKKHTEWLERQSPSAATITPGANSTSAHANAGMRAL